MRLKSIMASVVVLLGTSSVVLMDEVDACTPVPACIVWNWQTTFEYETSGAVHSLSRTDGTDWMDCPGGLTLVSTLNTAVAPVSYRTVTTRASTESFLVDQTTTLTTGARTTKNYVCGSGEPAEVPEPEGAIWQCYLPGGPPTFRVCNFECVRSYHGRIVHRGFLSSISYSCADVSYTTQCLGPHCNHEGGPHSYDATGTCTWNEGIVVASYCQSGHP